VAIRKNPDWHVWLGDVLHWIRTPPGIYVFIIFILGLGLVIQTNSPKLPPTYPTPVFSTQVPALQPQRIVPTPPPPIMKADSCPDGTIYVEHLAGCISGHRRTTNIFVEGTKNNCPDDAIFSDRFGRCIPMYSAGNYTIFAGNIFFISGRRNAYVYVRSGQIQIYNPAVNFNKIAGPSNRPIVIRVGATIIGATDSSNIRVEFDAAPY
jgi:hypothetical protein